LTSAIENVVRNAVNYTSVGSTIDLRLDRVENQARLRVRDAGPGVPSADEAKIFEPYFRTDTARQRKSGGSGLGLAIAKRAIERQGGRIRAQNADGGGLEVEIVLPLAERVDAGKVGPFLRHCTHGEAHRARTVRQGRHTPGIALGGGPARRIARD